MAAGAARDLRSIYAEHPKQAAFFRRDRSAPLRATTKTRRAGATAGGVREFLARAIEQPGFRGTYTTTTSGEAHDRAWSNDSQSGFAQVLRRLGEDVTPPGAVETIRLGGVDIELRIGDLVLLFSNGSKIDLYGADNLRRLRVKRGNAKHVVWVDEAQDFPLLDVFYNEVVVAALQDVGGECWLTGTPGRDCAGFFYDITGNDGGGIEGWEVHAVAAIDNPFFGRVVQPDGAYFVDDNLGVRHGPYSERAEAEAAARDIRWENAAGGAIRLNRWKVEDAHVQREFFGRWVRGDSRHVYPVHSVPKHILTYAPLRLRPNPVRPQDPPWLDIEAALDDLPINRRAGRHYQWMCGAAFDFGFWPDPFALVAVAFTHELPDVFELGSWKATKVDTDTQGRYMMLLRDSLPNLVSFVGDVAGKEKTERWKERANLEFDVAEKRDKNALEELLANDIRMQHYRFREGSPLLTEMRHLVYLPLKRPGATREVDKYRVVGGVVHGDNCCDAARYLHKDLTHHLYRPPVTKPKLGELEAGRLEAERFEKAIDKAAARQRQEWDAEQWGDGSGFGRGDGYDEGYGY